MQELLYRVAEDINPLWITSKRRDTSIDAIYQKEFLHIGGQMSVEGVDNSERLTVSGTRDARQERGNMSGAK